MFCTRGVPFVLFCNGSLCFGGSAKPPPNHNEKQQPTANPWNPRKRKFCGNRFACCSSLSRRAVLVTPAASPIHHAASRWTEECLQGCFKMPSVPLWMLQNRFAEPTFGELSLISGCQRPSPFISSGFTKAVQTTISKVHF